MTSSHSVAVKKAKPTNCLARSAKISTNFKTWMKETKADKICTNSSNYATHYFWNQSFKEGSEPIFSFSFQCAPRHDM